MAAKKEAESKAEAPPRGVSTSEFWLCALSVICGLAMASGLLATGSMWERIAGIAASALATLGYTAGRCVIKSLKE
jgi:hypothetical protein